MESTNETQATCNICLNCGKVCKDKRGLSIHEARCSGLSSFECSECGSVFQSFSNLKRHQTTCDKYKEIEMRKEYDERNKSIQAECDARIRSIQSEYDNRLNLLNSELVGKIMNLDKEIQTSVTTKVKIEKEEWIRQNNQELEILRQQVSSLIKDKQYLQKLIANLDPELKDDMNYVSENIGFKPLEYVYIIQEREFVKEGRPLYKIGRTEQEPNKRYVAYPKDSALIIILSVPNCQEAEKAIKSLFKKKFRQDRTIGVEYFEGDVEEMKKDFIKLLA